MKVTVLGCGTSTGVPMPGCDCKVCSSPEPRNKRLRASIWIQGNSGESIIVDTGPDFREQVLRAKIKKIDAIIYTHTHADHIFGFSDIRSFNFSTGAMIPIYATEHSLNELRSIFSYVFDPDPNYVGGGLPKVELRPFVIGERLSIGSVDIETFQLIHGNVEVVGLRIGGFVYATDCKIIPDKSKAVMMHANTLVLDGLRESPVHPTHLTLPETKALAAELAAKETYAIHMTHQVDYLEVTRHFPGNFHLAYDGLEITD